MPICQQLAGLALRVVEHLLGAAHVLRHRQLIIPAPRRRLQAPLLVRVLPETFHE